jgi:MmyB-like transcription regulator ligand binding domain
VLANGAAQRLVAFLPAGLAGPPLNVFRACLHPDGLAARTLNFAEWAAYLLGQLHRLQVLTADPAVAELANEVARYSTVAGLGDWRDVARPEESAILVPWRLRLDGGELSLFTTLTTFGTPQDITLAELAVELFYPADEASEAVLRRP